MTTPRDAPPLRLEFQIDVTPIRQRTRMRDANTPRPLPKLTTALLLGHQIEQLIRDGELRDYADAAVHSGLSRARISQLVGLTRLAPDIQEAILSLEHTLPERLVRPIVGQPDWERQLQMWAQLPEISAERPAAR